jgi:hypothetical protein
MSNLKKLRTMSARRVFKDQDDGTDFGKDDSRPTSPDKQVKTVIIQQASQTVHHP